MSLTPERWRSIEELYQAALDHPADDRDSFLKQACADEELRREIESMLGLASSGDALLRHSPWTTPANLGPYLIGEQIGAGGMGEVYRARDTRLGREVAVKVLLGSMMDDPERRMRFLREAQSASRVNHPNIVTIYDVGESEGRVYIAMEYVAGQTLDAMIPRGGMPWANAAEYAIQIAGALATAHAAGIVHRDLKPGNVMVTGAGNVKVLDFGLAKLHEPAPWAEQEAATMTETPRTREGVILGTASYMSPEQAEGKAVDPRSDIFSFGAVLYEMTTGQRAFRGDTTLSTLSAILRDEPEPVCQIAASVPRELERIINRCLRKDPERRFQNMADVRVALTELKEESESGRMVEGAVVPARKHSQEVTPLARRGPVLAFSAVAVLLVIALGVYLAIRERSPSQALASIEDLQVIQLTSTGVALAPAISPDGRLLAYAQQEGKDRSLWVRQIDTGSAARIVAPWPGRAFNATAFTPDGAFVEFTVEHLGSNEKGWWRVPFLGGTPKKMLESYVGAAAWSPDGRQVAFVRDAEGPNALVVADSEYAHERQVPIRARLLSAYNGNRPAWSPGGNLLAILERVRAQFGDAEDRFAIVDMATGKEKVLPVSLRGLTGSGSAWLDGRTLVVNGFVENGAPRQLWTLSYPEGRLSRLTNDLSNYGGISLPADRRSLVTVRSETKYSVWLADATGSRGTEKALLSAGTGRMSISWSGDRLLYSTFANGHSSIAAVSGGLAQDEIVARGVFPAGTVDDTKLVVISAEDGDRGGLWKMPADGRQAVQLDPGEVLWPVVTPDGRTVIFGSRRSNEQSLWTVPMDGGSAAEVLKAFAFYPDVSPDGRQLVYASSFTTRGKLSICDLPDCTNVRPFVTPTCGPIARWTPDGKGIAYYENGQGGNLWIQPLDGSARRQLTHFNDDHMIWDFAWSHDGKRLAIARGKTTSDIVLFKGLQR